ncbi:hypothetical protein SDC9_201683 [bioreactor metagenome]|uniref:Uncharacterized protein n=1 Tax=bioreactor metagenome TaxID=1076179 RepID=A0A645J0H8_9ZZZZ
MHDGVVKKSVIHPRFRWMVTRAVNFADGGFMSADLDTT